MDDFALLCEDCGYELDGLRPGANCPECTRPVERSRPEQRAGSAWQQSPGLFGWVRTFWSLLRRPREVFGIVQIDSRRRTHVLLAINLFLAAALIVGPWTGVFVGDPARGQRSTLLFVASGAVQVLLGAGVLFALTTIEYAGIRYISGRRRWRLTRAAAWQICAHASYGWILCGVLAGLVLALLFTTQRLFGIAPQGTLDLSPISRVQLDWVQIIGLGGPLIGYFAGMLVFETLTYFGVRACKYAATARP